MNNLESTGSFCSTREAARLLNVSVKTAQLWVESGVLQAWKTPGGHRRITRRSIDALVSERRKVLAPPQEITQKVHQLLIVEDDARTRRLYEMTLAHWGLPLDLSVARDGFEALLKIGEQPPDTLITDLSMPAMDGFRLIAALKADARLNGTRIIVVSGLTPAEIRARGGLPKDVAVLSKPIPFTELRKLIENHLVH